jgi:signal transduction histidine kinase
MNHKGILELKTWKEGNMVKVLIKDNGQGMSKAVLSRIYEPFFTTKAQGEGSGIGLDIVKKIIDKHMGSIEVESEPGKGTSFIVSLPIN